MPSDPPAAGVLFDHPRTTAPAGPDHTPGRSRLRLVLGVVAVLSLAVGVWISQHGVVVQGDGVTYVAVADNIRAGRGITSPFVNEYDSLSPATAAQVVGRSPVLAWPPLYPLLLAVGSPIAAPAEMARFWSVLGLAVLVTGVGALAWRASRGRAAAAAVAAGMVLVSPHVLVLAGIASSDLVAVALSIPALLVLPDLARRGGHGRLALVWFCIVAASLTRVLYLGMVPAAVLAIVMLRPPGRRRFRDAVIVVSAALPLLVWLNWSRTAIASDRNGSGYFPRWGTRLGDLATGLRSLLVPDGQLVWLRGLGVAVLVVIALVTLVSRVRAPALGGTRTRTALARRPGRWSEVDGAAATLICLGLVGGGQLAAFLVALVTGGFSLSIDARALLPLQIPLVVGFAVLVTRSLAAVDRDEPRTWAVPGALAVLVAATLVAVNAPSPWLPGGLRPFPPARAHDPALVAALAGPDLVFTDAPSTVYALTGRPVAMVPLTGNPAVGKLRKAYDGDLAELDEVISRRAVVFVFTDVAQALSVLTPTEPELVERFDLRLVATTAGARVYRPPS